jgi:hypothetical protein
MKIKKLSKRELEQRHCAKEDAAKYEMAMREKREYVEAHGADALWKHIDAGDKGGVSININAPKFLKETLEEIAEEHGIVPEYYIKDDEGGAA